MSYIEIILQVISPIIGGFSGWFLARRKNKLEADGLEVVNVEKNMVLYQKFIDDMTARNEERFATMQEHYLERIKLLELDIISLKREVLECKKNHKK